MTPSELLAQFSQQQILAFTLVLARIAPLFWIAPLFSARTMPGRVRGITAVALSIAISPLAMHASKAAIPSDAFGLVGLLVKEVLVGTAFAYTIAALFAALSAAGSLLDTLIGFSFGGLVDPMTGTQSSLVNQLYAMIGVLVLIAINGDAWMIQGLAKTYEAVPLLDAPQIGSLVQGAQVAFSGVFSSALMVAAPVLLALIVTDAAFGVVSKVVPQLNVFAVGFPAKVAVGLLLMGVSMPFVAGWLADELQRSVSTALDALKVS